MPGAVDLLYRKLETEGSSWSLDTSLLYTAQMTLPIETEKKQMTCAQPFGDTTWSSSLGFHFKMNHFQLHYPLPPCRTEGHSMDDQLKINVVY